MNIIYTPLGKVNQEFCAWSFRQMEGISTWLKIIRATQVLKHQYTPLVKVNQGLSAWSFRQLIFQRICFNVNIHTLRTTDIE